MPEISQLPASSELEQALLGAILIDPELRERISLEQEDFYIHRHRFIWQALSRLNGNTDMFTVAAELERDDHLDEIGGPAYLAVLVSRVGSALNGEDYAERIKEFSQRRRMITAANELARLAFDLDSCLDESDTIVERLRAQKPVTGAAQPIQTWAAEVYGEVEHRMSSGEHAALTTGFVDLDKLIGGLYPDEGTFFYLAGQPGVGKTILWANVCEHLALQAPGAMYSLEMKRLRLMLRSFSARTGLSVWDMRQGRITDQQLRQLQEGLPEYDRLRLFVSDNHEWTTAGLRADLYRLKREHGVKWFAVDYLALISDPVPRGEEWMREREISRRLLGICRSLGMACIAIHTLNKEGFKKHAGMKAFSGAAGVMYDADISAYLSESEDSAFRLNASAWTPIDLNLVKNRDGEGGLGSITLGRMKHVPKFITPSYNQPEEKEQWYQK